MPTHTFDDPGVRAAMRHYLEAVAALEQAVDPRDVMDRSDTKALAGLTLRKRLLDLGWTPPVTQRSST